MLFSLAVIALLPILPIKASVEGDGKVLYGEGTSNTPITRGWSANAREFGAESSLPTAGSTVKASIIESSPTRTEMVAGVINSSDLLTIYRWDGTTWSTEWSVTLPVTHTPSFDIVYEQVSGKAMVIYSRNAAPTDELTYRTYAGTSWSTATNLDAVTTSGVVHAVVAESRPETNEIAVAWGDSNLDLSANYWTGAAWAGERSGALETQLARLDQLDSKIQTAAFDVAFEQQGGELLIVWTTEGANGIKHVTRSVGVDGQWRSRFWTQPYNFKPVSVSLASDPSSDYIAIALEGELTVDTATSWRFMAGMWTSDDWDWSGTNSGMALSTAGQHRHDVAWVEKNGQVRALFMYDTSSDGTAYRVYNKNTNTFTSSIVRGTYSAEHTQVHLVANPHNRAEMHIFAVGTDSRLTSERMLFDDENYTWRTSVLETVVTTQATMSGWATSYAYDRYIAVQPSTNPAAHHGSLFYAEGVNSKPQHRNVTLADNSWTGVSSIDTFSSTKEHISVESSPVRSNEKIALITGSSGVLEVHRWDGVTWRDDWAEATGVGYVPRAAIVYEQVSGRAMVIYSVNVSGTNEMKYRIWDGASWTTAQVYDAQRTSGVVQYIVAKPRPRTNEIAVAWADSNFDLSANYWTGSAWAGERSSVLETNLGAVTSGATAIETPIVDLAFEDVSGELLIVWGHDTYATTDTNINHTLRRTTRTAGSSGVWSGMLQTAFTYHVRDVVLSSDTGADTISLIFHSTGKADGSSTTDVARLGYWTGSGWAAHGTVPASSVMTPGESDVATAWLHSGGQSIALHVFDRNTTGTDGLHYTWYNRTANTWKFDEVGGYYRNSSSPVPAIGKRQMKLIPNPNDPSQAMIIVVDDNNDLFIKKASFNGTTVTFTSIEDGGAVMTNAVTSSTTMGWKSAFTYQYDIAPPSILGVDIVNASGFSVASPNVTMVGVATGGSCQSTTGTFGTSAQSIRVENTTTTPGWSVSLAPTDGVVSNWSSDTATYDFNDASGSPSGCGDGADADTISGQLNVNPAGGSITAKSGCTTTGVSRGSSSAFSQGVVDSVTLMNATSGAETGCYWDLTGVALTQTIPALQAAGKYNITMTLTTVAN